MAEIVPFQTQCVEPVFTVLQWIFLLIFVDCFARFLQKTKKTIFPSRAKINKFNFAKIFEAQDSAELTLLNNVTFCDPAQMPMHVVT